MAHVSHRLSGAVQGALAGGGDPGSSPLYVYLALYAAGVFVLLGLTGWAAVKRQHIDLVIVCSHGQGGLARAAAVPLGSVPERLLADLPCSLLLVPAASAPTPA